ncbi:hypothetical protein NDU88_004062 [Pleurodeles waltl]|uniref:Uncharacterized protein n=1 Tax=Pleurodeles waltl TaxID=8319 RepID=A0AAV7T7B0_PLEWA|nr:hypothetical protein NDU88_004062 [Pleurodeles waltl]
MPLIVCHCCLPPPLQALKQLLRYPHALNLTRLDNPRGPSFWSACVAGIPSGSRATNRRSNWSIGRYSLPDSQAAAARARTTGTVGGGKADDSKLANRRAAPDQTKEQHGPRQSSLGGAWPLPKPACPGRSNATAAH